MSAESLPADKLIGRVLAERYEILEQLGEGAMGVVYKARHVKIGRSFAVKVLHAHLLPDPKTALRFDREAALAGRLRHANVVGVVDVGELDGMRYMVMEFAEGPDLAELLLEAPMRPDRIIHLVRQMLEGLYHAHEQGLIHRDLKPENVIIERDIHGAEMPRIVDFGIAILADEDDDDGTGRLTTNGLVLGTPHYMAPEQAVADPIDHRIDLFALGIVVYEMLCGRLPFDGNGAEVARANLLLDPPPISRRVPHLDVDPLLEAFSRRLMAKKPTARPATAKAARELLDLIDHDRPAAAAALGLPPEVDTRMTTTALPALHQPGAPAPTPSEPGTRRLRPTPVSGDALAIPGPRLARYGVRASPAPSEPPPMAYSMLEASRAPLSSAETSVHLTSGSQQSGSPLALTGRDTASGEARPWSAAPGSIRTAPLIVAGIALFSLGAIAVVLLVTWRDAPDPGSPDPEAALAAPDPTAIPAPAAQTPPRAPEPPGGEPRPAASAPDPRARAGEPSAEPPGPDHARSSHARSSDTPSSDPSSEGRLRTDPASRREPAAESTRPTGRGTGAARGRAIDVQVAVDVHVTDNRAAAVKPGDRGDPAQSPAAAQTPGPSGSSLAAPSSAAPGAPSSAPSGARTTSAAATRLPPTGVTPAGISNLYSAVAAKLGAVPSDRSQDLWQRLRQVDIQDAMIGSQASRDESAARLTELLHEATRRSAQPAPRAP
jgi:serine/threonine-protein kinase